MKGRRAEVGVAPSIRLRDVTRAETAKGLTEPGTRAMYVAALVVNTALCAVASTDAVRLATGDGLTVLSDAGVLMFAPVYLFLVIPVYLAGGEYITGQIRLTLVAVPNRTRLVAAKLTALAAIVIPAATTALLPGRLIVTLSDGLSLGAILLDLTRWTAAYVLMSCVAYALAVLMRSRIAPIAILALVPLLLATGVLPFPAVIRLLPDQLSLSLLGTPGYDVTALPPAIAAALLSAWAAALLVAQAVAVLLRDS